MNIRAACEALQKRVKQYYASKASIRPVRANHASQIGYPCLRNLVYSRLHWKEKRKPSPELQAIFMKGIDEERIIKSRLMDMGVEVAEGQITLDEPDYQLSGSIDCTINIGDHYWLTEIKGIHPYHFDRINGWRDFLDSPIYCKYPPQGQVYMFMKEVPEMMFIVINKSSGALKIFPMELDYEYAEEILQKCETIKFMP